MPPEAAISHAAAAHGSDHYRLPTRRSHLPGVDRHLDGYVNAQIRAQVTGYLLTQNYSEGSQVKMGDLLFQIDPAPL